MPRAGLMDQNKIADAVHEISMMVLVLLDAVETLLGTDAIPRVFQMPEEAGQMLSFSAFDIDNRVKALRDALT
jgi:hypothetical protein